MFINYTDVNNDDNWVDIEDLGAKLSSKTLPETPNVDIIDTSSISKRKVFLDTNFTHRDMDIELVVIANNNLELRDKLTVITGALKGRFNLRFKQNPSQLYRDVFLSGGIDVDEVTNSVYILSIKMTAYDPFRYSVDKNTTVVDGVVSLTETTISNNGNFIAKPVVVIEGKAESVSITSNGKTLTYVNLMQGNKIVIDNDKYTVLNKQGGNEVNALANWRNNFIDLESGDNIITIDGKGMNVKVTIEFRDTFL